MHRYVVVITVMLSSLQAPCATSVDRSESESQSEVEAPRTEPAHALSLEPCEVDSDCLVTAWAECCSRCECLELRARTVAGWAEQEDACAVEECASPPSNCAACPAPRGARPLARCRESSCMLQEVRAGDACEVYLALMQCMAGMVEGMDREQRPLILEQAHDVIASGDCEAALARARPDFEAAGCGLDLALTGLREPGG